MPRRPYARWRAVVLIGVHVLIAVHIAHWQIAGRTLAPLEVHEVLHTVHRGVVTAGFLFMALILVSVLVFGRFFCAWGCHLLALEDLSAWLLRKLGIKPRPLRSRALMLVPMGAMLYLFAWPQVQRLAAGQPLPRLRIQGDAEGWASFVTTDFWRNLPGLGIAIATLVICGGLLIYLLGTRAFCHYGCPYGALFRIADRFAPGRILARGDCTACGRCTASCTSGVRVHEEVAAFGKVLDPACLKDLDCVAACPNGVLAYGFDRPVPLVRRSAVRRRTDLTRGEEVLAGLVFLSALLVFRGLYAVVPILMAIGIAVALAAVAVIALRLCRAPSVKAGHLWLKRVGRRTRAGTAFAACAALLGVFTAHSAVVRYHEYRGHRAFEAAAVDAGRVEAVDSGRVAAAIRHLERAAAIGLYVPIDVHRRLASLHLVSEDDAAAAPRLEAVLSVAPDDVDARLRLGLSLRRLGQLEAGEAALRRVVESASGPAGPRVTAAAHLAHVEAARGAPEAAIRLLEEAVGLHPMASEPRVQLGVLLARLGRLEEAEGHLRAAAARDPASAHARVSLGAVLQQRGRIHEAESAYRAALDHDPALAGAWSNLGVLLLEARRLDEAAAAFERVTELRPGDPAAHRHLALIARLRGDAASGTGR